MPLRNRRGGLHRGTLFDTNVPSTSIDKDIFTDQEVEDTIADGDLILMLDVSETPDVIKYMTRSNFTAGLSGSTITITDNETSGVSPNAEGGTITVTTSATGEVADIAITTASSQDFAVGTVITLTPAQIASGGVNVDQATIETCEDCGCTMGDPKPGCECSNDGHTHAHEELDYLRKLAGI